MSDATLETSALVRDKLQELAGDLRRRGFQLEARASANEHLLWARRGELRTAVLVTDRAPRSFEELALRISLGDWAEGHQEREFIFVRCFSQWQGPPSRVRAKRTLERLRERAADLASRILRFLRHSRWRPRA